MQSKGLGDSIEKVTKATGIKTIAEAIAKLAGAEGCGCEERKQYLNELFPYGKKRGFLVLKDFNFEYNSINYKKGETIKISKDDIMQQYVINYVKDGYIKEI